MSQGGRYATGGGGIGNFSSLTVNPGPTILTGNFTVNGGIITMTSNVNAPQSIVIAGNGGAIETVSFGSIQGTASDATLIRSIVGGVLIESGNVAADSIELLADNGGIIIDTAVGAGNIAITSNTGSTTISAPNNTLIMSAGGDIDINSTNNQSILRSSSNAADAVLLESSGGVNATITIENTLGTDDESILLSSLSGGITINADDIFINSNTNNVSLTIGTATVASPIAAITINVRVGQGVFTGFTTGATGTQNFTINSNQIIATSSLHVTVSNLNVSGNNAFMGIRGITQAAGSIIVHTINNGAALLGAGDDVYVNFWILD